MFERGTESVSGRWRRALQLSLWGALCALFTSCGGGGSDDPPRFPVNLAWDAPATDSRGDPLVDLKGYRVYDGSRPGQYTSVTDVPNETGATVLVRPGTRYLAVTAYDVDLIESSFSDELIVIVSETGDVESP